MDEETTPNATDDTGAAHAENKGEHDWSIPIDDAASAQPKDSPVSDPLPTSEVTNEEDPPSEEVLGEDDPQLLDPAARSLDAEPAHVEAEEPAGSPAAGMTAAAVDTDGTSDTASIPDVADATAKPGLPDWSDEASAHRIVVELKRVESEVRRLLETADTRRKRKLAGTRRWLELEEDIIAWRHTGRVDEQSLHHLHELVARRHYLFKRLRFVAGTRPAWNT